MNVYVVYRPRGGQIKAVFSNSEAAKAMAAHLCAILDHHVVLALPLHSTFDPDTAV